MDAAAPQTAVPSPADATARVEIPQYSILRVLAVWAAAALPMAVLAWVVAPAIDDRFSGPANVPLVKALLLLLTGGLIWQFVLVVSDEAVPESVDRDRRPQRAECGDHHRHPYARDLRREATTYDRAQDRNT